MTSCKFGDFLNLTPSPLCHIPNLCQEKTNPIPLFAWRHLWMIPIVMFAIFYTSLLGYSRAKPFDKLSSGCQWTCQAQQWQTQQWHSKSQIPRLSGSEATQHWPVGAARYFKQVRSITLRIQITGIQNPDNLVSINQIFEYQTFCLKMRFYVIKCENFILFLLGTVRDHPKTMLSPFWNEFDPSPRPHPSIMPKWQI